MIFEISVVVAILVNWILAYRINSFGNTPYLTRCCLVITQLRSVPKLLLLVYIIVVDVGVIMLDAVKAELIGFVFLIILLSHNFGKGCLELACLPLRLRSQCSLVTHLNLVG